MEKRLSTPGEARCIAGYVGRRWAGIPLGRMARYLGREESYLLKPDAALERRNRQDSASQTAIGEIVNRLSAAKSGFLV